MAFMSLEPWKLYSMLMVSVLCAVLILVMRRYNKGTRRNMVPGPKGIPVIGNLHQLRLPAHTFFLRLAHKYGHIFSLRLGSVNTVVISSHEYAKEFFNSGDLAFASRPPTAYGKYICYNYKNMGMAPYGPYWKNLRKICILRLLNSKSVHSFACVRRQEIDSMVEKVWENSNRGARGVDLTEAVEVFTTSVIWRILCGRKFRDNEEIANGVTFRGLLTEISVISGKFNVGEFIPWLDWMDLQGIRRRMKRCHSWYDFLAENILLERIDRREKNSRSESDNIVDFLDMLLDEGLSREEIKALLFDLAAGGTETVTSTMEWAMSLLLKYPDVLLKVEKEINEVIGTEREAKVEEEHLDQLRYLKSVVKETMRLYPAIPLCVPHYSVEDTTLCGYAVPKRSMLFLNIWAINRDPAIWEDPEEFRPERFMKNEEAIDLFGRDMKSIPFGYGRRGCPGASMAETMMMLTLSTLVQRFRWIVPGELDMTERIGLSTSRKSHLFAVPRLP